MKKISVRCARWLFPIGALAGSLIAAVTRLRAQSTAYEVNYSHFHLTHNIQEGPSIHDFLGMMGNHAGRVALFGAPARARG
jgi:hypothetical protein